MTEAHQWQHPQYYCVHLFRYLQTVVKWYLRHWRLFIEESEQCLTYRALEHWKIKTIWLDISNCCFCAIITAKPLIVCHLRMNCSDANLDAVQFCCSYETGFAGVMRWDAFSWESHSFRHWTLILAPDLSHDPCTTLNEINLSLHLQQFNTSNSYIINE